MPVRATRTRRLALLLCAAALALVAAVPAAAAPAVPPDIGVGGGPHGLAMTSSGTTVYIANSNMGSFSMIDTSSTSHYGVTPVLGVPYSIALTPGGTRGVITSQFDTRITIFDPIGNVILHQIPAQGGGFPYGLAIGPTGDFAYVGNNNIDQISVVDISLGSIVDTIGLPAGAGPYGMKTSPNGDVYVANAGNSTVSRIDTPTNVVTGTLALPPGSQPYGVAFSTDGLTGYVSLHGSSSVAVFSTATMTVTDTIALPAGSGPYWMSMDPIRPTLYVANRLGNSMSVIDTATAAVVATIPVGTGPIDVAVMPDGSRAYVSNEASNSVTVLTLPILPARLDPASVSTPAAAPFSFTPTFVNATVFAVTTGALPPGLSLNTATGAISGTPTTVGTYTFTLAGTAGYTEDVESYSIEVTAAAALADSGVEGAVVLLGAGTLALVLGAMLLVVRRRAIA